jgi:hypothetical protein
MYLQVQGTLKSTPPTASERLIGNYREHLNRARGFAASTVGRHCVTPLADNSAAIRALTWIVFGLGQPYIAFISGAHGLPIRVAPEELPTRM